MAKKKFKGTWKTILGTSAILAGIIVLVPYAVFLAIEHLVGFQIPFDLETLISFWIIWACFRLSVAVSRN